MPRLQRTHGVLANARGEIAAHGCHARPGVQGRESLCNLPKSGAIQEEQNMMTQPEIIKLALRGGTKEGARRLVQQQVDEMVKVLSYDEAEARRVTLVNIGYYTGYLDHDTADRIMELFDTEHPIFGRTHPTPEEAFRLGRELGEQMKRRTLDTQDNG
jgi:hypothetical protein